MEHLAVLIFAVVGLPTLAFATDNYEYGADEYVTITKGISPDENFAITAHGEGEYGYDHFHLYLTDARTGRNVGPLQEITKILDTGAASYVAKWSGDSKTVTIVWSGRDTILSFRSPTALSAEGQFRVRRHL